MAVPRLRECCRQVEATGTAGTKFTKPGNSLVVEPFTVEGKTFAVVRPIHDPSIKGQRQILEWHGSPSLGPCFHRRCFSFFFHLASAALRATLLEILEEYLLLCFEEEEESFTSSYCVAAAPFHAAPADLFIYYAFRWSCGEHEFVTVTR